MRKGDFDEEMDSLYPLHSRVCGLVRSDIDGTILWQHPCVNGYSLFAAAFFVMNTIGLCAMASGL